MILANPQAVSQAYKEKFVALNNAGNWIPTHQKTLLAFSGRHYLPVYIEW